MGPISEDASRLISNSVDFILINFKFGKTISCFVYLAYPKVPCSFIVHVANLKCFPFQVLHLVQALMKELFILFWLFYDCCLFNRVFFLCYFIHRHQPESKQEWTCFRETLICIIFYHSFMVRVIFVKLLLLLRNAFSDFGLYFYHLFMNGFIMFCTFRKNRDDRAKHFDSIKDKVLNLANFLSVFTLALFHGGNWFINTFHLVHVHNNATFEELQTFLISLQVLPFDFEVSL